MTEFGHIPQRVVQQIEARAVRAALETYAYVLEQTDDVAAVVKVMRDNAARLRARESGLIDGEDFIELEPLGRDFEAVWDAHADELYEN